MVRCVDRDAHAQQRAHHALAEVGVPVAREVEVGAAVVARRRKRPVGASLEDEELDLRADPVLEPEPRRLLDRPAEHAARIAGVRLPVRGGGPADQARGALLSPRQQLERGGIRDEVHVRFGRSGERIDRRAVEPGPVVDRLAELRGRDGDRLDPADDVRVLEIDMADLLSLHPRYEVVDGFLAVRWCQCRPPTGLIAQAQRVVAILDQVEDPTE